MLTEEQLKNLKYGDTLVIHTTFDHIDDDGDLWFACPQMNEEDSIEYIHPKCVSLPGETVETPKHGHRLLFKKGDIVEMDTHGRDIAESMKKSGVELGKRYTVTEDENNTGYVSFIGDDGIEHHSMFFWLKLVTPVEESEPYYVEESTGSITLLSKCDPLYNTCWHYSCVKSGVEALAAAEAERDRLNTEWRKEQNNG